MQVLAAHTIGRNEEQGTKGRAVLDRGKNKKKALSYTCLNETNDKNIYHFPEHVSFNLIFFTNSNWPSHNLFKLETFQDVFLLCVFFMRKITFVLFCFEAKRRALNIVTITIILQTLKNNN